jgi:arylsulfatase A-like enzyme
VSGPVLTASVTLLLALTGCAEPPPPPSFIVISMDTTRADHLGVYGHDLDTTPNLDALAARGLVFDQLISVSENTLISHASLFTGLVPAAHGATHAGEGRALPPAVVTFADDFRRAGYQTAGFAAHGDWLNAAFGMDRGFETFTSAYRGADDVLAEAAIWLEARDRTRPFLLFIHLFDVHSDPGPRPYEAPEGFAGRFTSDYRGEWKDWEGLRVQGSAFLKAATDGHVTLGPADLAYLRNMYDEGLAATDSKLGAFLDGPASEALDEAFVLMTADHGEEIGEHGRMLHSSFYDEVVRIPGILVPPRNQPDLLGPPRVLHEQIRLIDIRPTLLRLAGLPRPKRSQGVSLVDWLEGERTRCPAGPAAVYHQALRQDGFKLIRDKDGVRLYDLERDPGERRDLGGMPEHKPRLDAMIALLNQMRETDTQLGATLQAKGASAVPGEDAVSTEALKAIGYAR